MKRKSTLEILENLVAFPTVSCNSNMDLIAYVRDYLAGHGVESRLVTSDDGTKANLFATIGGTGSGPGSGTRDGGIALSGHTDVVPVTDQHWQSDPFVLTRRGERLYGRGSADMKGFIAAVLAAVPDMVVRELRVPLHIVLSYDEEVGCLGVRPLIDLIGRELPRPEIVFVGEPTSMGVVDAHKGLYGFTTTVRGRAAHSSAPARGASAIVIASGLIQGLCKIMQDLTAATPADSPFEPPETTFNVGVIEGGNAINIVPASCRFTWEFRPVAAQDAATIEHRFRALAAETEARERARCADVRIETTSTAVLPPFTRNADSPALTLAKQLLRLNRTDTVAFGSEASLFQARGLSVAMCGPGNIAQAHQADEFIELAQLKACEAFLARLIDRVSSG